MQVPVFYSYAHEDEAFKDVLVEHLTILERNGLISGWDDRRVAPGSHWEQELNMNLANAKIIILLISSDFLASDYCYDTETIFALEQHEKGEARLVPIIIRPCLWEESAFKHIQVIPKDGRPVTSWRDYQDDAWFEISIAIRNVAKEIKEKFSLLDFLDNEEMVDQASVKKGLGGLLGGLMGSKLNSPKERSFPKGIPQKASEVNEDFGSLEEKFEKNELSTSEGQIMSFLNKFSKWYFSPLRISKWGGQQEGHSGLSKLSISEIKKSLIVLKGKGYLTSRQSKNGNEIYKIK